VGKGGKKKKKEKKKRERTSHSALLICEGKRGKEEKGKASEEAPPDQSD